jgi:hypothetical protein
MTDNPRLPEQEQESLGRLAAWLIDEGYAEEKPGYGHVTGMRLAEALLHRYEIRPRRP